MDLADVAGNVSDGVHVASPAGAWMALVFGFGGVRDYDGPLSIDPHLPHRWRSLSFPLRFQDRQLRVTLTHDEERYALEDGAPLEVTVRGRSQTLTVDDPLVLAAGSDSLEEAGGGLGVGHDRDGWGRWTASARRAPDDLGIELGTAAGVQLGSGQLGGCGGLVRAGETMQS